MTRINLIDPIELTDQHLIAEYREIRLLTSLVRRIWNNPKGFDQSRIPKLFTLNTGHVLFFCDKKTYITNRYDALQHEMVRRGFTPTHPTIDHTAWPSHCADVVEWMPTDRDRDIVRERIRSRIDQRPHWYRYHGKLLTSE